jgi:hypothetical protein
MDIINWTTFPESEWALADLKFASSTEPFCTNQRLQFGIHILH